jgi:hypothetical protein
VTGRIDEEIIGAAFKRLLRGGMAVTVTELAGDVGQPPDEVRARVTALGAQGRLRLEDDGRVAGAAGLSVGPDRHEIEIGGRRFWTWCAYDFLGIFGALRAAGVARTVSPTSGEPLEVHFERGVPLETQLGPVPPERRPPGVLRQRVRGVVPEQQSLRVGECRSALVAGPRPGRSRAPAGRGGGGRHGELGPAGREKRLY